MGFISSQDKLSLEIYERVTPDPEWLFTVSFTSWLFHDAFEGTNPPIGFLDQSQQ